MTWWLVNGCSVMSAGISQVKRACHVCHDELTWQSWWLAGSKIEGVAVYWLMDGSLIADIWLHGFRGQLVIDAKILSEFASIICWMQTLLSLRKTFEVMTICNHHYVGAWTLASFRNFLRLFYYSHHHYVDEWTLLCLKTCWRFISVQDYQYRVVQIILILF